MATSTDPTVLLREAASLCCIPKGLQQSIHTYLLNQISGLDLTWEQAILNSCDYSCIPDGMQLEVQNLMLESIVTALDSSPSSPVTPEACQHAVVDDWVTRVAANGGTAPSAAMYDALCQFMTGMDAANLTTKMKGLCCFVPGEASPSVAAGDLVRALTPLIVGGGNDPWTNEGANFVPGDLTINGLMGDGLSKWLSTGLIPTTIWASTLSAGCTIYNMTAASLASQEMGSGSAATLLEFICTFSDNNCYWDCWASGAGRVSAANAGWTGFLSGNRTAANASAVYRANSAVPFATLNSIATTAGARPGDPIGVFARTFGGLPFGLSARRLSFSAVHDGLTSPECQNFYNLVQALRTALGGGYV